MAKISDSVCLNHPNTPAVTRCATCGKPVCEICIVTRNGINYCSQVCAANAEKSAGRVDMVMESKKRANSKSKIRSFLILIILILIAAAAYYFYTQNKDDVNDFMKKTEQDISAKIKQNADETQKNIQEGIPSSSKYKDSREDMVK